MADEQTTTPADANSAANASWMSDVQRALAMLLIGTLSVIAVGMATRVIWSAPVDDVIDLSKTLQAALVNMGLVALGFFFGNTIAKMQNDRAQTRLVDKLSPAAPVSPAPLAPTPTPDQIAAATLVNGELAYYQALATDDAKKAFLAMSTAERQATIAKG